MDGRHNPCGPGSVEGSEGNPHLHLDAPDTESGLAAAMASLEAFLERHGVDAEASFSARLTMEEIVTNIIKYAYSDDDRHEIEIDVRITQETVEFAFADDGKEFNPLEAAPPNTELPFQERPIGGLGLHLVREISERLEYRRDGDRNQLIVHISRKKGA